MSLRRTDTRKPASASIRASLEMHLPNAQEAQAKVREDCTASQLPTSATCIITMNLEKVIFLPTLTHSDMYHMRQLSVNNISVHVAKNY